MTVNREEEVIICETGAAFNNVCRGLHRLKRHNPELALAICKRYKRTLQRELSKIENVINK